MHLSQATRWTVPSWTPGEIGPWAKADIFHAIVEPWVWYKSTVLVKAKANIILTTHITLGKLDWSEMNNSLLRVHRSIQDLAALVPKARAKATEHPDS